MAADLEAARRKVVHNPATTAILVEGSDVAFEERGETSGQTGLVDVVQSDERLGGEYRELVA